MFIAANGDKCRAKVIGDLPVTAETADGERISFTLSNVRHVPGFNYTLLSVEQMWEEQRIDTRVRTRCNA